jgi:hypothetical protein
MPWFCRTQLEVPLSSHKAESSTVRRGQVAQSEATRVGGSARRAPEWCGAGGLGAVRGRGGMVEHACGSRAGRAWKVRSVPRAKTGATGLSPAARTRPLLPGASASEQDARAPLTSDPNNAPILKFASYSRHTLLRTLESKGGPEFRRRWCRRFEVPASPAASAFRSFNSIGDTGIKYLLVPLCLRSSSQRVLPRNHALRKRDTWHGFEFEFPKRTRCKAMGNSNSPRQGRPERPRDMQGGK